MQVAVSIVLLGSGIAILTAPNSLISHGFDHTTKCFASAWIGVVIGYWIS